VGYLQAAVKAQEYEAKLSNLKQTAQKKEKEESKRWEARLSVVQQIYASVQVHPHFIHCFSSPFIQFLAQSATHVWHITLMCVQGRGPYSRY